MTPNSLQELYVEQLQDLYDAEQQMIKALPEIIDAATAEGLKQALSAHLDVTKEQATRLEQICAALGVKPKGETCKGIEGVIEEGSDLMGDIDDAYVRDAAIIAAVQRVEHYEMAGYGTARTYAKLLGEDEASQWLQRTLTEEKEADLELTMLASEINANATAGELVEDEDAYRDEGKSAA